MKYIKIVLRHIKELIVLQFKFANGGNVAANDRLERERELEKKRKEFLKKM